MYTYIYILRFRRLGKSAGPVFGAALAAQGPAAKTAKATIMVYSYIYIYIYIYAHIYIYIYIYK